MKATSIAIKIQIGKHYKAHDPHRLILIQFHSNSFIFTSHLFLTRSHSLSLFNDMMDLSCCDLRDVIKWRLVMLIYEVYNSSLLKAIAGILFMLSLSIFISFATLMAISDGRGFNGGKCIKYNEEELLIILFKFND